MILRKDGENSIYIDAVLAGRDFFHEVGDPPQHPPVPLDFLVKMTEAYVSRSLDYHHQIEVRGLNYPRHRFLSTFLRRQQSTTILVHHGLNHCYTRFAVAIELSGLMLGVENPTVRTTDIIQHLHGLRTGVSTQRNTPLYGEDLAFLVAIELLVPMCHRERWEQLVAERKSPLDIATVFRIPEMVVGWMLDAYWDDRVRLHEEIKDVPPIPPGAGKPEPV